MTFAAVTDELPEEVAAAGHYRMVIRLTADGEYQAQRAARNEKDCDSGRCRHCARIGKGAGGD